MNAGAAENPLPGVASPAAKPTGGAGASFGRKMIRSGTTGAIQTGVGIAVGILLTPFTLRCLGDRDYGVWVLVGSFLGYANLMEFGIAPAVARFYAVALGQHDFARTRAVLNTALGLIARLSLVFLGLVAILYAWMDRWAKPEDVTLFRRLLILASIALICTFLSRVIQGVLDAHVRQDITANLTIARQLINAGLVVAVLSLGFGVSALVAISMSLAAALGLASFYFAKRIDSSVQLSSRFATKPVRRELLGYGASIAVATVADSIRWQSIVVVTGATAGAAVVTHLNIGLMLGRYSMSVVATVLRPLLSVFSQIHGAGDRERLKRIFDLTIRFAVPFSLWLFLGLAVLGKQFIICWVGEEYTDVYLPLCIFASSLCLALSQNNIISLIQAMALTRFYAATNLAEAIINATGCIILGYRYGLLGLALAFAIPMVVTKVLVQPWVVMRRAGWSVAAFYRTYALTFLRSAVPASGATLAVWSLRTPTWPRFAIAGAVYTLVFWAIATFLVWSREERQMLAGMLLKRRSRRSPQSPAGALSAGE